MFTEANSVEYLVLDVLAPARPKPRDGRVGEGLGAYYAGNWQYIPAGQLDRSTGDVLIESQVREALIRLNPEIAQQPDRADEVIYQLRAILLSVNMDGLVRANQPIRAGAVACHTRGAEELLAHHLAFQRSGKGCRSNDQGRGRPGDYMVVGPTLWDHCASSMAHPRHDRTSGTTP